jgi:hypothetical protein
MTFHVGASSQAEKRLKALSMAEKRMGIRWSGEAERDGSVPENLLCPRL